MAVNVFAVANSAPTGPPAAATLSAASVSSFNKPAPAAPGSSGQQAGDIKSQLVAGNPGGAGVGFGIGIGLDTST